MLAIAVEKVCNLIQRVEPFDAKVETSGEDPGSGLMDDSLDEYRDDREELEDDPTFQEIVTFIDGLNLDEQICLVALTWLGRGTFEKSEWDDALQEARHAHTSHTGEYLVGIPLLGTYLEEGLNQLGYSCD